MKRSITVLGALIVALWVGSLLQGQEKKETTTTKTKGTLPAHWSKLGLTDDQKVKVQGIRGEFRVKIDALKQQIRDLEKEERQAMEKVLTDAQKSRLKEILVEKAPSDTKEDKKDKKSDSKDEKKSDSKEDKEKNK